ncbi:hypothetical protein SAMN04488540_102397 [Ferrimonas sediminum]|uniref:Uncharacterized protein n=1 Tax=Ferrimonas sediminum TaxID=718193 RepID=A0A1G8MJI1_9GAMM|nr:DUF5692 family protein [Ferrimonas sediminum]SDI68037.1 hypothetical protein SAMN04488540_102397 [Ferrimonas sediminum]
MFLFEPIPWYSWAAFLGVLVALILLNEISRRSMWAGIACFIVLPLILTFTVWPKTTSAEGSSVGTWFHWAKVYSSLAGCVGFMAIRYIKGAADKKWVLMFPPAILAINIAEAVVRDFQCFSFNGMVDGIMITGGVWNIMNGVAGILNIIAICGWAGIFISNDKFKDMLWPDMLWFWIVAYDLWNFAYVYNCVGDHAFYAGGALLLSCTIPAFFMRKGAWLQHRAHTLGFWMMFVMCFPSFVDTSMFAVKASNNPQALWWVSAIALASNVALVVYQFRRIAQAKLHPMKDELYQHLPAYQKVAASR